MTWCPCGCEGVPLVDALATVSGTDEEQIVSEDYVPPSAFPTDPGTRPQREPVEIDTHQPPHSDQVDAGPRHADQGQYPPSAHTPIPVRPKGPKAGETVPFDLGGEVFYFKLGKTYELFDLLEQIEEAPSANSVLDEARQFRSLKGWLFDGLSPEQRDRLEHRLRDRNDELDIDHLLEVFQHIAQRVAGRSPT